MLHPPIITFSWICLRTRAGKNWLFLALNRSWTNPSFPCLKKTNKQKKDQPQSQIKLTLLEKFKIDRTHCNSLASWTSAEISGLSMQLLHNNTGTVIKSSGLLLSHHKQSCNTITVINKSRLTLKLIRSIIPPHSGTLAQVCFRTLLFS